MSEKNVLVKILEKGGILVHADLIGDSMGQGIFSCCTCPYRDECEAFYNYIEMYPGDFADTCYVEDCPHADEGIVMIAERTGAFLTATTTPEVVELVKREWERIKKERKVEAEKASSSNSSSEVKGNV